jgi:hypothetical protein
MTFSVVAMLLLSPFSVERIDFSLARSLTVVLDALRSLTVGHVAM